MGNRGIATRIALAALASAAVGLGILALGVTVVGGQVFTDLMMQAGDSAEQVAKVFADNPHLRRPNTVVALDLAAEGDGHRGGRQGRALGRWSIGA